MATPRVPDSRPGRRRAPWWVRWIAFVMGAWTFSWSFAALTNGGKPGKAGSPLTDQAALPDQPPTLSDDWGGFSGPGQGFRSPAELFSSGEGLYGRRYEHDDEEDHWVWSGDALQRRGVRTPTAAFGAPDARTRRS